MAARRNPQYPFLNSSIVFFDNLHLTYALFHKKSSNQVYEIAPITCLQFPFGTMPLTNLFLCGSITKVIGDLEASFGYTGYYQHVPRGLSLALYRAYDARLGRWLSKDPLGEAGGVNLYGFVDNNPTNWIDMIGLAPGDPYPSADAAGIAAIREFNPISIKENAEYAGSVYKNDNGTYSYTKPNKGTPNRSKASPCPLSKTPAGGYHTHGNYDPNYDGENFSPNDKFISDRDGIPEYLGTPSGKVKKYTPPKNRTRTSKGTVTTIAECAK
jgi:RHS repeat-associated protein